MREAVLGETFQRFNPVLNPNSVAEEKVVELLYHPLYHVYFPDFSQNLTDQPQIEPVLLKQAPEWVNGEDPNQNFKILRFELKSGLKWSDGSKLTTKDVAYTFERLKEENGNRQFKNLLQNYQIIVISDVKFEIRPIAGKNVAPNPQLIYALNFSPISSDYYENLSTLELANDLRSTAPEVSSGYFSLPLKVQNPDSQKPSIVDNPIRGGGKAFSNLVLEKNKFQNYKQIYLDKYIFTSYSSIEDAGGEDIKSIQKSASEGDVDFFTRVGNLDGQISADQIAQTTGLEKVILPTNTYYKMFFNVRVNNFFINQNLRKYVFCEMQKYRLPFRFEGSISKIDEQKNLIPLHFGVQKQPDCANSRQELLDFSGSANSKPYTIKEDAKNNITQLRLNGNPIKISLVALTGTESLSRSVQAYLTSIGVETNLEIVEAGDAFEKKMRDGQYNIVFLPITMVNRDPYTIFGAGGQNFSKISQNNRLGEESRRFGVGVEEDLKNYSQKGLPEGEEKDKLVNFFEKEFVSINLFQVNQEVFVADNVRNLLPSFGLKSKFLAKNDLQIVKTATFSAELYKELPVWYTQTKREWGFR
jgi:ABC-type transport system substrate-binding protein